MYILTNPEKSILEASAIYVVSLISTRQLTSECVMDTFFENDRVYKIFR